MYGHKYKFLLGYEGLRKSFVYFDAIKLIGA
jgi:hypothetical protein